MSRTWRTYSAGRRGLRRPEWSSAQCLESLLVSIQSLMSEHPYLNEPVFEVVDSEEDLAAMESYTAKVIYIPKSLGGHILTLCDLLGPP